MTTSRRYLRNVCKCSTPVSRSKFLCAAARALRTVRRRIMIMRVWHGYTAQGENARAYEDMLRKVILPGIHRVEGYRGAYLCMRDVGEETEFVTVTLWESMAAIRSFAGADYARAVIHEEARPLLTRYDETAIHYEAGFVA